MPDHSHLDDRYFIDENVYNCPFCNRRHVAYTLVSKVSFDWSNTKSCDVYIAHCNSCGKKSMHLTFESIRTFSPGRNTSFRFIPDGSELDAKFFYSVPTSFFVMDNRIPAVLRELLTEAEGSLKSNFLTGASACARKVVYELAQLSEAIGEHYEDRIKSLKAIYPDVDGAYFDTLLTIQELTSSKVHENASDGWESRHLRVILASLREILHAIYVVPALRADRRESVLSLKEKLLDKANAPPVSDGGA